MTLEPVAVNPGPNLFDLNQAALRQYFADMEEKPFRAEQVMKWLYHQGVADFDGMTNLSKKLRERLAGEARFETPVIVSEQVSADGVRKWLMQVDDANRIETVYISEPNRGTLCVSSQAGCALNCAFCATGKQGYGRNLSAAEIIGQVWQANKRLGCFEGEAPMARPISNVVLMGMGEPLLNVDNVLRAVELMTDTLGFGLANKRVTLSTAGVVPGIVKLTQRNKISLAVSLHAATDALRDKLVPINRTYPLRALLPACRAYSEASGHPVTFEYVMLNQVNDSAGDARTLAALLKGLPAKVNLIPFNPFPGADFTRSPAPVIDRFRDLLMQSDIITITRKTRGDDIAAACGQLTGQVAPRARRLRIPRKSPTRNLCQTPNGVEQHG